MARHTPTSSSLEMSTPDHMGPAQYSVRALDPAVGNEMVKMTMMRVKQLRKHSSPAQLGGMTKHISGAKLILGETSQEEGLRDTVGSWTSHLPCEGGKGSDKWIC